MNSDATYTVELVPYTVKTGPGWRSAVRIVDNSSIPFTGKAFVRRRIFGTVWANKADALERAEREAATIHETHSIP